MWPITRRKLIIKNNIGNDRDGGINREILKTAIMNMTEDLKENMNIIRI